MIGKKFWKSWRRIWLWEEIRDDQTGTDRMVSDRGMTVATETS